MFWNIVFAIASFALQLVLAPKPQNAKPKSLEDFQVPTAEEGREIPPVFGTADIADPNVTWYGDLKKDAIKGPRRYLIAGPRQVLGYKYSLGMQMSLCHGPADAIYSIRAGDKEAWKGASTGGRITINKPSLFGGDKSEGGISGAVDICMGAPDQLQNDYLVSKLGANLSAFRGVVTVVLRRVYLGTSNYIKNWEFRLQRIFIRSDGSPQWYPEKAAIGEGSTFTPTVNQRVTGLPTSQVDYAVDLKHGFLVNCGTSMLQVWRYPDMSTPLWSRTDLSPQSASIDDAGNVIVSYQNGTFLTVHDINTGEQKATITMGLVGNAGVTSRAASGSTYVFLFEGSLFYLASGSGAFWTPLGSVSAGYGWLTSCRSFCTSPTNIYLANNGFLDHQKKVRRIPWSVIGLSGSIEVDLSADLFGDIASISWIEDLSAVLIIDTDSGLHLYNSDLSSRLLFKHGTDENKWRVAIGQFLMSNRIVAGDDLIAFRATAHGGGPIIGNVIVKYRISDLTLVSLTDASDVPYFNADNSGYSSSGVDPDNDYMVVLGFSGVEPLAAWSLPPSAALDMNPAHIIRECLTDRTWGLGYNEADIDDDSFRACADTFYDEGFGLTFKWNREEEIEKFISMVQSHPDVYLYVSRSTGKFVLKAIRDDYDLDTLPVIYEEDVIEFTEVTTRQPNEAVNSVLVKYTDRVTRKDGTALVTNTAQAMQATQVLPATREYPGIMRRSLALRVGQRDVRALGAGLTSGRIVVNRAVAELNPGDPFRLVSSRYDLNGQVMRVIDLSFGDGRSNKVGIRFFQDVFKLTAEPLLADNPPVWTPPSNFPLPVSPRLAWEMPFREARQMIGDGDLATMLASDASAGLLQVAGSSPTDDAENAQMEVNAGTGFVGGETLDFAPGGFLAADLAIDATSATLTGAIDLDLAELGTLIVIVGPTSATTEICRIDAIAGSVLTIARGFLDTVPQSHAAGCAVVFFDDISISDFLARSAGDSVSVKLLTKTGLGVLDINAAPTDLVSFNSRAIRPLRPAGVTVEGDGYGPVEGASLTDFETEWANRNRLIELASPPAWTDADEVPETGQTTVIEVLAPDGSTVVTTHPGLTGTSYAVPLASFGGNSSGFIQVGSERDGYREWQAHRIEVLVGYGLVLDGEQLTLDGENLFLGA